MKAYQRGQQGLIVLVEAGQVGVLQDIGGVAMNAAVVDGKADLVQPCRPAEDGAIGLLRHLPGAAEQIEQGQHALFDPGSLTLVDAIVGGECQGGALANVMVLQALLELVEQSFTQGAIGIVHPLDGQRGEEPEQDGHRGGKHLLTLFGEAGQLEIADPLVPDHLLLEPLQPGQGDGAIGPLFSCNTSRTVRIEPELPRQLCQPSLRYWLMMGASWCWASSTALLKAFRSACRWQSSG